MSAAQAQKFERIQVLRFFAATAVVAFHAQATALRYLPPQGSYRWLDYGAFGVDLFFVISGFIIRFTVEREPTAGFFLRRRLERVVPLYWLCTLAFAALTAAGVSRNAGDGGEVGSLLAVSLSFLAWTNGPGESPLVYVGWSLEYEMLFYLFTAVLLLWTKRPTLPLVVLLGASVLLGGLTGAETAGAAPHFFANPILLEFLFGVLLADILLGKRPWTALAITVAVLVAVAPFSPWGTRVLIAGLPSAAAVGLAAWLDRRQARVAAPTRWLARLGDASYSIYLVQVFTISAACKLVVRIAPGLPLEAIIVLTTAATVAASYLVFLLVERPIQRLTHHMGRRKQAAALIEDTPDAKRPATLEA